MDEYCVYTDVKNGIGNVILSFIVGLSFSRRLTELTGNKYDYKAFITGKWLGNHEIVYTSEHENKSLPHPKDIKNIFPNISFVTRLPNNVHYHHLLNTIDIKTLAPHKRIFMEVDEVNQTLSKLDNQLAYYSPFLNYHESIYVYIENKYGVIHNQKTLGIHIRIWQQGDYMRSEYSGIEWYERALDTMLENSDIKTIYLVTGGTNHFVESFKELVNSKHINLVHVANEPYYIDLCILSLCDKLIVSNSTFSFSAALINNDLHDNKTVIYPEAITRDWQLDKGFKLQGFAELKM